MSIGIWHRRTNSENERCIIEKVSRVWCQKMFIIGLVIIGRFWMNCGVEYLRNYTVKIDLKLCNILLGMMNHSSCHPRIWCELQKKHSIKREINIRFQTKWTYSGTSSSPEMKNWKQRNLEMLFTPYTLWQHR